MSKLTITVLEVCDHFPRNGLYKIKVNDRIAFIFRNGDSWGVLSHYIGKSAKECMYEMREDLIAPITKAIDKYLKEKGQNAQ